VLSKQPLTIAEVYEAIDAGIADIAEKWKKNKLPHKQRKAFKLWKKYRPKALRRELLARRQMEIEHVSNRISALRKESKYSTSSKSGSYY
jgi:hypothetical protein